MGPPPIPAPTNENLLALLVLLLFTLSIWAAAWAVVVAVRRVRTWAGSRGSTKVRKRRDFDDLG